ncbi:hypothetical protein [Shimia aestuarii]|uniref:Phospholipase A2 n=1 Tax=Shimia aestuarii TaxID=254406 RepID=A0A1I4P3F0_9RHOB|nr:hypothetical protein [Shimia aestuarii]SFM22259.1 hypothetical protein SAMN04488042_10562 [Shimia aestuarii]
MNRLKCASLLLILGGSSVGAEEVDLGPTARLEVWRHARLEATRTAPDAVLAPFTTDGCSGGMSSAWTTVARLFPEFAEAHENQPPWEECCVIHDRAYHLGGVSSAPEDSYFARLAADEALETCVAATANRRGDDLKTLYDLSDAQVTTAYELIGKAMFDAVRVGGAPCSGLSWRWGYGWPQCW